jgi:hypothetical protein
MVLRTGGMVEGVLVFGPSIWGSSVCCCSAVPPIASFSDRLSLLEINEFIYQCVI